MSGKSRFGLSAVSAKALFETGNPRESFDGTIDIYKNYIDIFRKDKKPAPLGLRVLSSLSKKGRFVITFLKSDIASNEKTERGWKLCIKNNTEWIITLNDPVSDEAESAFSNFLNN